MLPSLLLRADENDIDVSFAVLRLLVSMGVSMLERPRAEAAAPFPSRTTPSSLAAEPEFDGRCELRVVCERRIVKKRRA